MKNELQDIFIDTKKIYSTNKVLIEACEKTRKNAKLYLSEEKLVCSKNRYQDKCKVVVSGKRTFEAASCYVGNRTCVLNFANSFTPGGGVLYGARAQEECLCRCSTLYHSLESDFLIKNFYERHCTIGNDYANDDAIYSPSVKVFKSDTDFPKIIDEEKWFDVDVVTCAAPDLNDCPALDEEGLFKIHEQRLRRILDIAVLNGIEVLVLGAFGCGAFMNPPEIVASVAKKVLSDYEYAFKTVEFAVYCVPGKSENFEVFKEILSI